MQKFLAVILAGVICAASFSVCQAAKVSLYDDGAKSMLDKMMYDIEYELRPEDFPYVLRNFNLGGELDAAMKKDLNLPDKYFKAYGCDLGFKTSANKSGGIAFVADEQDRVYSVLIAALFDKNTTENQQTELLKMLVLTAGLVFHATMTASEMELLVEDMRKNIDKGKWGIWHGDKYINCAIGKNDGMFICWIDATDGKN